MADKVTKEMNIMDIVQAHPESIAVFQKYGLGCIGCAAARFENLEAGARVHGFDPQAMVDDINMLIEANEGQRFIYLKAPVSLLTGAFFV